MNDPNAAAYGGAGWSPRTARLSDELGDVWSGFAVASEWGRLRSVVLHKPGKELAAGDPNSALMLASVDPDRAALQHDLLERTYRDEDVQVYHVGPVGTPTPNQLFVADLMFMTPSGALVARPASAVRAGEERWVARRLADLGVPILRSVSGAGTFEGADAAWLDSDAVLLGRGLRTNAEGAAQVATTLHELGVTAITVDLPHGCMHLMGSLRIVDRDLALVRSGGLPWTAIEALRQHGYEVRLLPSEDEIRDGMALNFVTVGPRRVVMPAGNPVTERFYRDAGISVVTVEVGEIVKAAGAIGCLTGILGRDAQ